MKKLLALSIPFVIVLCLLCSCAEEAPMFTLEGNRTTGYEWQLVEYDESIISIECEYETNPRTTQMSGVGGVFSFTVTPIQPGETDAVLLYMRSWEGEESAIERAVFHITVDAELNTEITRVE